MVFLGTNLGDRGGPAVRLHAWDLECHHCLILRALGLQAAVLEAGIEDAVGDTQQGRIQGQDGVIVTALLQGVVGLVPTPGCWLAQPRASICDSFCA